MNPSGEVPRFSDDVVGRCKAELYTLFLVFRFHEGNNHLRKALTIMIFLVWAVLEIANAVDSIAITLPPLFEVMRIFVFLIIGRMWNIELTNFAQSLPTDAIQSDGGEDDTETDD